MVISVGCPLRAEASTCGYCSLPGQRSSTFSNHKSANFVGDQISCEVYQQMIDRGWRRSGTYFYQPDLKRSCCPQYTIKLDALAFKTSKSQRKALNRWNRFILCGESDNAGPVLADNKQRKCSGGSNSSAFDLVSSIHTSECDFMTDGVAAHEFRVSLEPSVYTAEKFDLFQKYQSTVHNDPDNSPSSFRRFLVESPLLDEPIPYASKQPSHLPLKYGSYHQLYRLDSKLIAMAVLDILPNCVSSVYFMYDNTYERFSLGKLSALREASLAREMHDAGAPDMDSLCMGFYIHSCQKMRYKGEYSPSYLLDPEIYHWYPLTNCIALLDKNRYACFSSPEHSIEGAAVLQEPPPRISSQDLNEIFVVDTSRQNRRGRASKNSACEVFVIPAPMSKLWRNRYIHDATLECIHALGISLSKSIVFRLDISTNCYD